MHFLVEGRGQPEDLQRVLVLHRPEGHAVFGEFGTIIRKRHVVGDRRAEFVTCSPFLILLSSCVSFSGELKYRRRLLWNFGARIQTMQETQGAIDYRVTFTLLAI